MSEANAFDINDILDGVVFDEEPKPMELRLTSTASEEAMMMQETDSVTSENIEQVKPTLYTCSHHCSFASL